MNKMPNTDYGQKTKISIVKNGQNVTGYEIFRGSGTFENP